MTSLSEHIAQLADVAPKDVDEEDFDAFDDNTWARPSKAATVGSDEEQEVLSGQRYRGEIDMGDDPRYAGKRITRAALRAQRGIEDDSEGEDVAMPSASDSSSEEEGSDADEDMAGNVATDDIEAELEALEADDAQVLLKKETSEAAAAKAEHTRNQMSLYESTLELRIKLQKAMPMAHRMPRQPRAAFVAHERAAASALGGAVEAAHSLVSELITLQDRVMEDSVFENAYSDSDDDMNSAEDRVDAQWQRLSKRWEATESEVVDIVSQWQRKLLFASGTAGKKLRAINQDILTQVEGVLANKSSVVSRSRVLRTEASRELGRPLEFSVGGDEGGDPHTYDDAEFYGQLLNEYIKTSQAATTMTHQVKRRSVKKNVDRKASKGRRLRYHTHAKLVNFMAPHPPGAPPLDLDSLHASLFQSR